MASRATFGVQTCRVVSSDLLKDIYGLCKMGTIDKKTLIKVTGAHAAARIFPFRETSDIDVIVSDAPVIQELLVKQYPTKYFLQSGQSERDLYRNLGTDGAQASLHVPIDLIRVSSMAQGHPVTWSMISIDEMMSGHPRALNKLVFADPLDLIVLKIGAIVSEDRDPKKKPQDKQDLMNLVIYQNDKMTLRRSLNARDESGEDLHARYLFCYYDHPKVRRIGNTLRSWLSTSPGDRPNLLDPKGNVVLQYADRERERDKWEAEDFDDDDDEDMEF
ncbi:hypothetical protein IW261DRAFT_1592219 [Armillaria novae-zelandiae]|uniref:Uncharacterized protein n=1 Tax=Armillaria novae-zelandiae TaxID=153914 RepID=A0AA39PDZ2_9AGAR|nr:hypothetical protein IW261DRAFT_1592219 [Armillaria novae-zelandiae]